MNKEEIQAELRLFKSFTNTQEDYNVTEDVKQLLSQELLEVGVLIDKPEDIIDEIVISEIKEMYGIKPEQWNNTFHKSFSTVKDAPIEKLIAQQLLHYITTYGFEELGLYNEDLVYIPIEQLDIPEYTVEGSVNKISLNIVHSITTDELKERLMTLLTSGIALSEQSIKDILTLSDYIDKEDFNLINNKEIRIAFYKKYNIVPSEPVEFLKYVVYNLTGKTLIVKDLETIQLIKEKDCLEYLKYFNNYIENNGYKELGSIFLRYKPIFLAFKRKLSNYRNNDDEKRINYIINKIRQTAKKTHKPVKAKILDNLTQIKDVKELNLKENEIKKELKNITVFKEISIINSLSYRLNDNGSILYKIRNGKAWVEDTTNWEISVEKEKVQNKLLDLLKEDVIEKIKPNIEGKTIYLPNNINYTVPTSEKQFVGNTPEGSYIEVNRDDNLVLGIHWKNIPEGRVDLDLHAQNRTQQFGWNTSLRSSSDGDFFFTGDITDACSKYGATELFYVGKTIKEKSFLLTVNKYSSPAKEVPFEFIIAKASDDTVNKDYVVDPNKVLVSIPEKFKVNEHQQVLGFIKVYPDKIRYYFNDFTLGNSIVTRQTNVTKGAFDYLYQYTETQLKLREVLNNCNVTFLKEPKVETFEEVVIDKDDGTQETLYKKVTKTPDIDLSLNNIDKTTLIKIIGGK